MFNDGHVGPEEAKVIDAIRLYITSSDEEEEALSTLTSQIWDEDDPGWEQARREHEQASRDNPLPGIDWRREGESLSSVQQLYRHVYDMLAMGNTTLFLDVYPLHVFYMQQGFGALESCLDVRKDI